MKKNLNEEVSHIKKMMGLIIEQKGSQITDYPLCVQSFGQPIENQNSPGTYYVSGTGNYEGYYFYLNGKGYRMGGTNQINDIQVNSSFDYYCYGKELRFKTMVGVSTGNTISVTENDTTWDGVKSGTHSLKVGSSGPLVRILQAFLIKETGVNSGGPKCEQNNYLGCDGKFGNGTRNALIQYQKKFSGQGMKPDGVFGKQMYQISFNLGHIKIFGDIVNVANQIKSGVKRLGDGLGFTKTYKGVTNALKSIVTPNKNTKK